MADLLVLNLNWLAKTLVLSCFGLIDKSVNFFVANLNGPGAQGRDIDKSEWL